MAIGASAGGLEALQTFFDAVPVPSGMAYVVVQHLSPDFKSLMDELLVRHTKMRVCLAENEMPVEPDTVYLNPPRQDMIISQGRLLLQDKDPRDKLTLPIDTFFRSLASDQGERGVAIILSGTGSDGSRSLQNVVEAGGLVLVQAEDTAAFDGMPKSAITTGLAHYIVAPERMAEILLEEVKGGIRPTSSVRLPAGTFPEPGSVQHVFRILQDEFGLDFTQYKPSTVGRRLERRMLLTNTAKVEDYVTKLLHDKAERNALYHDLLIGVTRFFRDTAAFKRIAEEVVPALVDNCKDDEEIRVWIPGCATGEEVYTICILFREYIDHKKRDLRVKVFATDVHRESLDRGSAGTYAEETVEAVEPSLLEKYFVKEGDHYIVTPAIRQMVAFAPQNLLRDPPFTRIDLLVCRNLLIYFEPQAQQRILTLFHFSVRTNGYLFLGSSESLGKLEDYFEQIDRHWKIYRKHRDSRLPAEMRRPIPTAILPAPPTERQLSYNYNEHATSSTQQLRLYDALLSEFMPPGILFSQEGQLLHAFGDTKTFLEPLRGRPRLDISEMLLEDLRLPFSSALERVRRSGENISLTGISVNTDQGTQLYALEIRTVDNTPGASDTYLAIIKDMGQREAADETATSEGFRFDEESQKRMESLERELQYTKEHLRTTIEELETSNEELQASNEELLASNEELQSTNEELHSLNEELYTVNSEHQAKITEMTELTNDMNNLMRSTSVGTLFVDLDLRIRRFTPAAAELFSILTHDIGRSLEHFTSRLDSERFLTDVRQVLDTGAQSERTAIFDDGKCHLVRIVPYKTDKGDIEGAVANFIDITNLHEAETALDHQTSLVQMVMDTVYDGVIVIDGNGQFSLFNRAAEQLLGMGPGNVPVQDWVQHFGIFRADETTAVPLMEQPLARAMQGETVLNFDCFVKNKSLPQGRHISVSAAPLPAIAGEKAGAVCTFHDCTHRVEHFRRLEMTQTELENAVQDKSEKLEVAESRYRLAMESAEMGTWFYDSRTNVDRRSAEFNRILGLPALDTEQGLEDFVSHVHKEDRTAVSLAVGQSIKEGGSYGIEFRINRPDGSVRWLRDKGQVIQRRDDGSVLMAGAVADITDLKSANDLIEKLRGHLERTLEIRNAEIDGLHAALQGSYCVVDHELRGIRANAAAARLCGMSPENFSGKRLSEIAGETGSALEAHLKTVLETRRVIANISLHLSVSGQGAPRSFSATFFPMPLEGSRDGAGVVLQDVTAKREAEEELVELQRLQDLLVDGLKVVVCRWNVADDTAEWGPVFTKAFGHPAGYITEASAWWLDHIHPDDRDWFREDLRKYQTAPENEVWECTYSFQRSNGTYAQVKHWFTAARKPDGSSKRLLGVIVDLTNENRIMNQLMQHNVDLETLVYIISHDLKEPLRSIRTFTELLATEHGEQLNEAGIDLLERLSRNSARLDVLINDVLELSRAQQLEVPNRGIDGAELVERAIAQLQDALEAAGATVRVSEKLPNVHANLRWATQALYNLLHNALKFGLDGSSNTIDVYAYAPVGDEPPMKGFVIADRGPGIRDELRERIFELFRKGETGKEGTGAGLAIVREVARRHGGNAWHRPRTGGGSEFIVTFGEAE